MLHVPEFYNSYAGDFPLKFSMKQGELQMFLNRDNFRYTFRLRTYFYQCSQNTGFYYVYDI